MLYDLLIVGGGINGAAIAREAARNGWSVRLVERDDLAGHTSSASTKLIHGGLRYLEHYEFKLVREGLAERTLLMNMAPHIIEPLQFALPHANAVRPWWMVRAGLLLYDWLAGRSPLPRSRSLKRTDTAMQAPLQHPGRGFVYWDCKVDDSRLVVLNAMDAARHGAIVSTRTAFLNAARKGGEWEAELSTGEKVKARALVNASGPWVLETLGLTHAEAKAGAKLVKGSHIAVPRLFDGEHAYLLQQPDRRIVFAIPWAHDTTMIGTTDVAVERPQDCAASPDEIEYLCAAANRFFKRQVAPKDVSYSWCGVRPLYDDGASEAQQVTRDYVLELDDSGPPCLSVFGGKVTTARHLAEVAVQRIGPYIARQPGPVTRTATLPGGEVGTTAAQFAARVARRWPWLGEARAQRMARAYGQMLLDIIGEATCPEDLGQHFGAGLTAREVDWQVEQEWARTVDDILWRRTKLGLEATPAMIAKLNAYLKEKGL